MDINNIGVAIIVENSNTGKILMIEEEETMGASNKKGGNLSIIVGHLKINETLIEAATREVEEESGLSKFKIINIIRIFHFRKGHVVFLFHAITDQEITEKGVWLSVEEIKRSNNLRPNVIEAITVFENGNRHNINILYTV